MNVPGGGHAKRLALEVLGWVLLVVGVAALILPGPGILLTAAGLAVLSQQYEWAERRVDPVMLRGLRGAAYSVQTWPRILLSVAGALVLVAFAVLWIVNPPAPSWWFLWDWLWLPGGEGTGVTLILSALLALGLIVYSYRRFHDKPEAVVVLQGRIDDADDESPWHEAD